jgi:hypothetical protein
MIQRYISSKRWHPLVELLKWHGLGVSGPFPDEAVNLAIEILDTLDVAENRWGPRTVEETSEQS